MRILVILLWITLLIPLLAFDFWWVRIFDFPQLHFSILSLLLFLAYLLVIRKRKLNDYIFIVLILGAAVYGGSKIIPYSEFYPLAVDEPSPDERSPKFRVLIANVLQNNHQYDKLKSEVSRLRPEVLLLMEVNKPWLDSLHLLTQQFPHRILQPQDNTYGMALFSKFPLEEQKTQFLSSDTIPSISSIATLKNGQKIHLFGVHPSPPMPQHNPSSADRDAELMLIAREVRKSKLPVIVMGDFNDVSWSPTTRLFSEVSELLDVRKGRGLFNSFSAHSTLMRWPLDHFFVSPSFMVNRLELGQATGSDHFPLFIELSLATHPVQKAPQAGTEELNEAHEQIEKENREDSIKRSEKN